MRRAGSSGSRARRWLLLAGALAVGVAAGFVAKRAAESGDGGEGAEEERRAAKSAREVLVVPVSTLRSGDTIETIAADTSEQRYGRLALWLLDASSDEMEAMFRRLGREEDVEGSLFDLLMVQWTQVDPRAAIEAAKGTEREGTAWWAWGKSDPQRALAAAAREVPKWLGQVMRGAGQTHPDLAQRLLAQFPKALSHTALEGIVEGLSQSDPRAAVEFGRRHGREFSDVMEEWARREPEEFLQWCTEQAMPGRQRYPLRQVLQMLAREHPDRIGELARSLPSGRMREELLTEAVKEMSCGRVDAAVALVERETSGRAQSRLFDTLGSSLAEVDVERSMELFRELGHLEQGARTEYEAIYPGGSTRANFPGSFRGWVRSLAAQQPEETMALVREVSAPREASYESWVVNTWLEADAAGFAAWLANEPPGTMRDSHAFRLSQHLLKDDTPDLIAATAWAASAEGEDVRRNAMQNVIGGWAQHSTAADTERYFESGEAPALAREAWDDWRETNALDWEQWQAREQEE